MSEVHTQTERDALEAAARAIHDRHEAMTHWVKTLKNAPRQFEESSIREVHRQDAQAAITAYLTTLSERGMRVMPREATEAMLQAGGVIDMGKTARPIITAYAKDAWRSMFDAFDPNHNKNPQSDGGKG